MKKLLQNKIDESDTAEVKEDLEEQPNIEQEDVLAAELRQLKLLRLPTSFQDRTMKNHKRDTTWHINQFFTDEDKDEAEEEAESDEETDRQMPNSTEELPKHEEKQIRDLDSNEDK